jgi:DNA-binding MarR family transcriptional regulator
VSVGGRASSSDARRGAPEEARALVRSFLSDEEELAWYGLLETHEALVRALDARLLAQHHMPLSAFEALIQIAHAEDGAISISELAERIRLSPSQVSRLVIDLEHKGLFERHRSSTDARSTHAGITEAGRAELREAAPAYLATIRAQLFDRLSEREVKQLRRIWERIRGERREGLR